MRHGDYGEVRVVLLSPNTPKICKRAWKTRLKNKNAIENEQKAFFLYMANMPIGLKLNIC